MKKYNNFNEILSNNYNTTCSVFNDYRSIDEFEDDVNYGLYCAFDEWYDKLNTKQKENLARFGIEWFDETEQADSIHETSAYRKLCDEIKTGGVDNLFGCMQENNNVVKSISRNFYVDITDEEQLRKEYGEDYKLSAVDCLLWCLEYDYDNMTFQTLEKQKKAREDYFNQFDFRTDYDGIEE